jgi:Stigma-specific protein, Stig1
MPTSCSQNWTFYFFLAIIAMQPACTVPYSVKASITAPTRSNFLRAAVMGSAGRRPWCGADPKMCMDRDKNPWGGNTCCLGRHCMDTARDKDNCGVCGRRCPYGLLCCGGFCIDIHADPEHCGACYNRCGAGIRCDFGMCDYVNDGV